MQLDQNTTVSMQISLADNASMNLASGKQLSLTKSFEVPSAIKLEMLGTGGGILSLAETLKIRGILLTMYDKRNKLSSQVEKEARDYFNNKVYSTVIPRNVRLSEAPSHGVPVLIYDKNCPGSISYFNFTDEFINQDKEFESAA